MKLSRLLAARCAISAIVGLNCIPLAHSADGVRTLPDSGAAMGMVGGRLANLRDPSVTRTNPANLPWLTEDALMITAQPWYGQTDFTGVDGRTDSMIEPWKPLGSMYFVMPMQEGVVAGVGITAPFGIAINWPRDGAFRYVAPYDAVLQTASLSPAVGFKITDRISAGIGLDVFYSRLKLDQYYPWSAVSGGPAPDGEMVFEGDGWGLGGYLGLNIKLAEHHRLALTGRLPVKVKYEGDFSITNTPAAIRDTLGAGGTSSFDSDITHPGGFGVGYGVDITDRLTAGIDFEWTGNSAHDDVPLTVGRNQALLPTDRLLLDWKDSWSLGSGFEYKMSEAWRVRGGYLFSKSPLRDSTYTASIPTNDRHLISMGTGYTWGKNTVDFAYTFSPMETRNVRGANTPAFDGSYEIEWHVFTLSYTRRF